MQLFSYICDCNDLILLQMTFLIVFFWLLAFIVFYTFFGYGILLWLLVKVKDLFRPVKAFPVVEECPDVTLLIAAYNEEDYVEAKMQNCRSLDYPADRLHITWVTDGSSDSTPDRLREYPENTVLHQPERGGKTAALNRAMEYVHTPIVIMTDANTDLNPECIRVIVRKFDDPKVGCVSGEKRVRREGSSASASEGVYWKYESFLKSLDDRLYSAMGAAGELIAIRRELWTEIPAGTLVDDMILSMGIVRRGYRIAYTSDAYAIESPSADIGEERKRKVRLGAGGFQAISKLRDLLNPFKYGVVAFQFFSHRVLRWAVAPSCLVLLLIVNIALVLCGAPLFYTITLALQALLYISALIGKFLDSRGKKTKLSIPYYFLFANFTTFAGLRYYLHYNGNAAWEKAKRAS